MTPKIHFWALGLNLKIYIKNQVTQRIWDSSVEIIWNGAKSTLNIQVIRSNFMKKILIQIRNFNTKLQFFFLKISYACLQKFKYEISSKMEIKLTLKSPINQTVTISKKKTNYTWLIWSKIIYEYGSYKNHFTHNIKILKTYFFFNQK